METQDHKKPTQTEKGSDGHGGVHVCNKCGWPYPKAHPSARHRRSHKKVCGTIDGYKLDDNAQEKGGSDGELNSDDELLKTPSGTVERTISRRSSSGVGSRSSRSARSEDEVFDDAVTEFNESPAPASEEASGGGIQRFYSMLNENDLDDAKGAEGVPVADDSHAADLLKVNQLQTVQTLEGENEKVETSGFEENIEIRNEVDSPATDKGESCQAKIIDSGNGNITKTDINEEHDSTTEAKENAYVLAVPDALPLQEHPEIAVEDLDYQRGEFNVSKAPALTLSGHSVEHSTTHDVEEGGSGVGYARTTDRVEVHFKDHVLNNVQSMEDVREQEDVQSAVAQSTVGEPDQIIDVNASNADINDVRSDVVVEDLEDQDVEDPKVSCREEQKPIALLENVFPELATIGSGRILGTTSYGGSQDTVKGEGEQFALHENVSSKVSEDDLAVGSSMLNKLALDEVPSQVRELINTRESYAIDNDGKSGVECAVMNGNEMKSVGEEEIEFVHTGTAYGNGLSVAGPHDGIDQPFELERSSERFESNTNYNSGVVKVGHLQADSLLTSQNVGEIESIGENGTDGVVKTDAFLDLTTKVTQSDMLEGGKDAGSSLHSSAAVDESCSRKFAESSSVTEGDKLTKQQVSVAAADTLLDTSSQTDSLEGNWGSVSVMSTASDAQPATDTPTSNHPQVSYGEESTSLQLKPVIESQPYESQALVEPGAGIEQMEGISEIQTSEEQQQKSAALQTGLFPTVAHVVDEPHRGQSDEEIIAKVTNWSTGKQHTALKTLLGEATAKSRAESPIHHNMTATSLPQPDAIPVTNNGVAEKKENVVLNPETEAVQEEMGKEWNSPARYPVNIKTEKRRTKSRTYWAPFLCCSSVNAR